MSPPSALDAAIIAAMRADPNATQRTVRKVTGGTEHYFSEAVKRLRYAGKIEWDRFALSPSMQQNTPGASGTARKAPGAASSGAAKRGSASAPQEISPAAVPLPPAAAEAKDGAGNARRDDRRRHAAEQTLPGPSTLAEQVKAEAKGKAERRALATKISIGLTPLPLAEPIGEKFRRLAREVDEEELEAAAELEAEERRQRDLERLPTPSAVLRRAQRDWPAQCRDVQAIATELGIGLGECWRRVIKAGVDCLREGGDGEAVA